MIPSIGDVLDDIIDSDCPWKYWLDKPVKTCLKISMGIMGAIGCLLVFVGSSYGLFTMKWEGGEIIFMAPMIASGVCVYVCIQTALDGYDNIKHYWFTD